MAIPVLPILKRLGPLIVDAGRIAAGLRSSGATTRIEDRVLKIETETIRAGEILKGLAEQLHAVAQQLRAQADATEALERRIRILLIVSIVACGVGLAALVTAFLR